MSRAPNRTGLGEQVQFTDGHTQSIAIYKLFPDFVNSSPVRFLCDCFEDGILQAGYLLVSIVLLFAELAPVDPEPYKLELAAVDACRPDDALVCAAAGSMWSGIWGELLSTAARNTRCVGVIVGGTVRDVAQISNLKFSVFARCRCPDDCCD